MGRVFQALSLWVPILACAFIASGSPSAAASFATAININPIAGNDSQCGLPSASVAPCKSIARAIQLNVASLMNLSAGIYHEATINISNAPSLVISGVPDATVFDCSRRQGVSAGAAFSIINSTVTFVGVSFQNCSDPTSIGGAITARGSSVAVSQCSFTGCSAASGGAVSVTGPGSGLFLSVQNSNFSYNSAYGTLTNCPSNPTQQPCSTWGGAIATFEIFNVSISDCRMVDNKAVAIAPIPLDSTSSIAGGGCVSVLFRGNASGSSVRILGSTFLRCTVDVATDISRGNGMYEPHNQRRSMALLTEYQDTVVRSRSTSASRLDRRCWTYHFSPSCSRATYFRVAVRAFERNQATHTEVVFRCIWVAIHRIFHPMAKPMQPWVRRWCAT
jgi:hypothetical protein